jgi:hypothetical protein
MNLKDTYTSVFLKAAEQPADEESIKKCKPIWWYNFRKKDEGGLRLTEAGLEFIQNQSKIKTYQIDIDKNITLTPQVLIWLDQFIDSPYFIDKKQITVIRERVAFELHLFSGDVKKMGYAKAMNKRLRQES